MSRSATETGGRAATDAVVPGKFALSVGKPNLPEPAGFRWTPLGELARLESGHTPSRARSDYWDGEIPWIGIRDATENHGLRISDTKQHITDLGLVNSSARLLPAEAVCLSRTASVGYVVIMGRSMATSQDFVNWVCGDGLSPSYLRYLLMAEQDSVKRFAFGSVHQTMYYPDAKALYVCVPSRAEQQAAAQVLEGLDDKIAANATLGRTAGELVEAHLSQALARGVRPSTVDEVATFHNRRRLPLSAPERAGRPGEVPYYGATGRFGTVDSALFDQPLVLVGEDGTVVKNDGKPVVQYIWGPSWVNNHAHVLTGKIVSTELLTFLLRRTGVRHLVTGAVQPKLSMGKLRSLTIQIPQEEDLSQLEVVTDAACGIIRSATEESRTLAALRDALLPALMSGKIVVKDAERQVEAVV